MIKCNVNICGLISHSAIVKKAKDDTPFVTFGVTIPISGSDGTAAELFLNVSCPGNEKSVLEYSTGRRISANGTMYIRKVGERTFYNLRLSSIPEFCRSEMEDKISGSMDFKGKIKKEIKEGITKTNSQYQSFSAFASDKEKDGDTAVFTWVNFYNPRPIHEEWFKPDNYVNVQGDLAFRVYKNNISIECKVNTISQWIFEKNEK